MKRCHGAEPSPGRVEAQLCSAPCRPRSALPAGLSPARQFCLCYRSLPWSCTDKHVVTPHLPLKQKHPAGFSSVPHLFPDCVLLLHPPSCLGMGGALPSGSAGLVGRHLGVCEIELPGVGVQMVHGGGSYGQSVLEPGARAHSMLKCKARVLPCLVAVIHNGTLS